MTIKQLYSIIAKQDNYEYIMSDWINIFDELLSDLKIENPKIEKIVMNDLYVSVFGEHFDMDTAYTAVSEMQNVDGTKGEHWDIDQTTSAAKQANIQFKKFNEYDFYYAINMLYSDYYNIFGDDSNSYIQLATAWLNDPDVPEGKAWRYYKKVVKSN